MSDANELGIGALITGNPRRDAIHIAVVPLIAYDDLDPGESVGMHPDLPGYCTNDIKVKHVGITDPFIKHEGKWPFIPSGSKVWVWLYPQSVTSLRHEWSHPEVDANMMVNAKPELSPSPTPAPITESEQWLRNFAECVDADYVEMMAVIETHFDMGDDRRNEIESRWPDYLTKGGKWEGQITPDELWRHAAVVLNREPPKEEDRWGIFSCSC